MFQPAQRVKLNALLALMGPAGGGKTVTALQVATYLTGGKDVFLIDTENGRSLQYSIADGETPDPENRRFEFQYVVLDNYSPKNYIKAIDAAIEAGAKALIIDSLSHAWAGTGGVLELKAQKDAAGGNSYTNWGPFTKMQSELFEKIMGLNIHVIATLRTKNEYVLETSASGKSVPKRVGQGAVQRDDAEYNFNHIGMVDQDHNITWLKDTSGLRTADQDWTKGGRKIVETLLPWLNTGTKLPMTKQQFVEAIRQIPAYADMSAVSTFVNTHQDVQGIYKWDDLYKLANEG